MNDAEGFDMTSPAPSKRVPAGQWLRALAFILFNQTGWHPGVVEEGLPIVSGGASLHARVYRRRGKPVGTIVAIHGMTPRGNGDPRMTALCRALAACGYTVVSPRIDDVAACVITAAAVDDIEAAVHAVAGNRGLAPTGSVSVISASFSAGMSVIAAARPRVAHLVDALCLVGGYGNADSAIRYLLLEGDADPYGRLIILKNFIAQVPGFSRRVPEAIGTAILDEGFKRLRPQFPGRRTALGPRDRRRLDRLLGEAGYRLREWNRMLSRSSSMQKLMRELSVTEQLDGLMARLVIIHGATDRVIPPAESRSLHTRCRDLGKESFLLVSPLLDHGDVSLGLHLVPDIARMAGAFAAFFGPPRGRAAQLRAVPCEISARGAGFGVGTDTVTGW